MKNKPSQHNYERKIQALIAAGKLPDSSGADCIIQIYHDDGCAVFTGGLCDCDPDIVLEAVKPTARRLGLD